jgi:ComF family protein
VTLGNYEDTILDRLIHLWKYEFDETARDQLFRRIDREIIRIRAYTLEVDAIVFVPLHSKRFCERGFDQAEEIAKHLGKRLALPVLPAVVRARATIRQALLSELERKAQMRDNPFRVIGEVQGKTILLVDDVITTGATTEAVKDALTRAGVAKVQKFALAMT